MKKSFLALVAFFASVNFAAAASNGVDITCPEECKLECTTSSNSIHCECVSIKDGGFCSARISTASIQIDGEETPVQNLDLVDVTASDKINNLQKVQKKAVSARAAKVGTQVKSVNMATPIDVKPQVVEKAAIGEVRPNGPNSWMACPPDCSFYTYPDGVTVCMNRGIECPGNNGGIRYYEGEKPTQYAINDVVSTGEIVGVSLQNDELQKKNTAVSARAAVKPVSQAEKNSLEPVAQGDKDLVEKYKIIWDGYEYTCPCGFVSIDDMPPKCKRGNEDKCKGVVKPVSQDR